MEGPESRAGDFQARRCRHEQRQIHLKREGVYPLLLKFRLPALGNPYTSMHSLAGNPTRPRRYLHPRGSLGDIPPQRTPATHTNWWYGRRGIPSQTHRDHAPAITQIWEPPYSGLRTQKVRAQALADLCKPLHYFPSAPSPPHPTPDPLRAQYASTDIFPQFVGRRFPRDGVRFGRKVLLFELWAKLSFAE